ncbi:response regulator transcription factor [Salinicola rhizosphaerae]|nr:response regulator transcription factor [Salinicola rhizosphaerae]
MTTSLPRIAIVEDNDDLREELRFYLSNQGFLVWDAANAEIFWKQLHRHPADIVLIDIGLPGEDGFSMLEFLHQMPGIGRVVMTARGGQQDRLRGLDLGADLFLVKPVNFSELAVSLKELGKRLQEAKGLQNGSSPDEKSGNWRLRLADACLITPSGLMLHLSPQELTLLDILIPAANHVFPRELLHDRLFTYVDEVDNHRIDVILSRLRQKARQQGIYLPIRSIFGKGIVFTDEAAS